MENTAWGLRLRQAGLAFGLSAALVLGATGASNAQATDAQIKALQDQINQLQKAISALTAAQAQSAAQAKAAEAKAAHKHLMQQCLVSFIYEGKHTSLAPAAILIGRKPIVRSACSDCSSLLAIIPIWRAERYLPPSRLPFS